MARSKLLALLFCVLVFLLSLDSIYGKPSNTNLIDRAWRQFEAHNYQKCIEIGKLATDQKPLDSEPHFVMGRCNERLGNFLQAYEQFGQVCKLDPSNQDAFHNRAVQSLKLFDGRAIEFSLKDWKNHFSDDARIPEIRKEFNLALKEQRGAGYTNEEAKAMIKQLYLESVNAKIKNLKE